MEIRPYVAALLGSALFAPVIYWNATHNWNSIRHVAYIGGINEKIIINLKLFLEFWGSQAGLLTPLVLILVILAWSRVSPKTDRDKKWIYFYLFMTSFPMIFGFAVLSLHTRVYPNWPGAGYLTASVMAAAFFGQKDRSIFRTQKASIGQKIWPWAVGSSYCITLLVLTQAVFPLLPIPAKVDPLSSEISGWDTLGQKAGAMVKEMRQPEKTFLFGLHYQEASEMAFYAPGNPKTVSINRWARPNVYDYWWEDRDLIGWDGIGVTYDPVSHTNRLNQVFQRVDPPVELKIFSRVENKNGSKSKKPVKIFYIYRGYGFKGGLRWIPEGESDIRVKH
jgi:undecaprenyl-diphosphatase